MLLLHPRPCHRSLLRYRSNRRALTSIVTLARCSSRVIEIALGFSYPETLRSRRGLGRTSLDELLEQHVHEQVHRLRLEHERSRRPRRIGVEVLVDTVRVHDCDIARLPVVADAVVDLVAPAVEDVERRLVHMPVLL